MGIGIGKQCIAGGYSTFFSHPYSLIVGGALSLGVGLYLVRRYADGGVCTSKARLDGKTVIITGANTGIGKETAIDLARRGARVILACRSVEKGEKAAVEVRERSGNVNAVFRQLDLSSLTSVRQFSAKILEEEPRIDILINNAGVMMCPYSKTVDGFEMQFGTNHLGHFLLTNLLLDRIKEAISGRVIIVASRKHRFGKVNFEDLNSERSYGGIRAYCQSKLANVLFTRALAKRLQGTNATANCLHPGSVATELQRHVSWPLALMMKIAHPLLLKNVWQGAQTSIYCAVSEEMEGVSGQYLADCYIQKLKNPIALDDDVAERLWQVSCQMVGLQSLVNCVSIV